MRHFAGLRLFAPLGILVLLFAAASAGAQTAGADTGSDNAQKVAVDPGTKKLRAPTPEEARDLSQGTPFVRVPQNIQVTQAPGGGVMAQLPEDYMDASVVTLGEDGKLQMQCVRGLNKAAELVESGTAKAPAKPATDAKNSAKAAGSPKATGRK